MEMSTPISACSRVEHTLEVAHVSHVAGLSRLDRDDHLLGLALGLVVEEEASVDAAVGALLVLHGPGAHQSQGPPLELPGILSGKRFGIRNRHRLTDNPRH